MSDYIQLPRDQYDQLVNDLDQLGRRNAFLAEKATHRKVVMKGLKARNHELWLLVQKLSEENRLLKEPGTAYALGMKTSREAHEKEH